MKGTCWVWHLIQLKENNFLLKQLCASADQRDVLRQHVDPGAQGLLRNIWKLHIQLQTSQIRYEFVYWGIPQFQSISSVNLGSIITTKMIFSFTGVFAQQQTNKSHTHSPPPPTVHSDSLVGWGVDWLSCILPTRWSHNQPSNHSYRQDSFLLCCHMQTLRRGAGGALGQRRPGMPATSIENKDKQTGLLQDLG